MCVESPKWPTLHQRCRGTLSQHRLSRFVFQESRHRRRIALHPLKRHLGLQLWSGEVASGWCRSTKVSQLHHLACRATVQWAT